MWFKNLRIYRLAAPLPENFQAALEKQQFMPCMDLEASKSGWAQVKDGQFVYRSTGNSLLQFCVEKKSLPASAIKQHLNDACKKYEAEQGFYPGKKAKKELKEKVVDELLPRALATRKSTSVWIDQSENWIVIDTASSTVEDAVLSTLIKAGVNIESLRVNKSPASRMTAWLNSMPSSMMPDDFSMDDAVTLELPGELGTVVKYKNADLSCQEIDDQLQAGMQVVELAMTYADSLSFALSSDLAIKRIRALEVLQEKRSPTDTPEEQFEADFLLMTLEFRALIDSLIISLGGEVAAQEAA